MIFDDEFPVYGNVTSIDQVERIQEYVDNKILDALSWIAGKLDLVIRGHTLVIGTIIEQSGKQIKQEQRRIQRVIDKYEKTAELATFQGVLGNHVPIGDYPVPPQDPVPPLEEPFPYDPPVEPPVEPPVLPPVQPPVIGQDFPPSPYEPPYTGDNPPRRPFPWPQPEPPEPPTGNDNGNGGTGGDFPTPGGCREDQPCNPCINPNDEGVDKVALSVWGGRLCTQGTFDGYTDNGKRQELFIHGQSILANYVHGTNVPVDIEQNNSAYNEGLYARIGMSYDVPMPLFHSRFASPFDQVGEAYVKSAYYDQDVINQNPDLPFPVQWIKKKQPPFVPYNEPDGIAMVSNSNPRIRA